MPAEITGKLTANESDCSKAVYSSAWCRLQKKKKTSSDKIILQKKKQGQKGTLAYKNMPHSCVKNTGENSRENNFLLGKSKLRIHCSV